MIFDLNYCIKQTGREIVYLIKSIHCEIVQFGDFDINNDSIYNISNCNFTNCISQINYCYNT